MSTLDRRAKRVVWGFLIGVTVLQGALIYFLFPLDHLGHFTFAPPGTIAAWAAAALTTVAFVAYAATRNRLIAAHMLKPATWGPYIGVRLVAIPMAFVTGFFEEGYFRKYLMSVVMAEGYGPFVQIAVSAVVFGLVHGIWGLASGNWRSVVGPIVSTGILGALLAAVFLIGERSLAPCAAAHIAINLLLEPWLIMAAATGSWGKR